MALTMGLLPDTQNCRLRMRQECWEHFPHHRLQKKPLVSDPGMHYGRCITHVLWCMSGSLTSRCRGKRSQHSWRMRNPQFYVSGKRPMQAESNKSLSFIRNNFKQLYPFNSEMIENAIIFQNFSHKNSTPINASMTYSHHVSGIILWMRPTNERRRYNVTSSLIGWAHLQNDPWCIFKQTPGYSLQNGPAFRVWPLLLTKIYDHMTSQWDLFFYLRSSKCLWSKDCQDTKSKLGSVACMSNTKCFFCFFCFCFCFFINKSADFNWFLYK